MPAVTPDDVDQDDVEAAFADVCLARDALSRPPRLEEVIAYEERIDQLLQVIDALAESVLGWFPNVKAECDASKKIWLVYKADAATVKERLLIEVFNLPPGPDAKTPA